MESPGGWDPGPPRPVSVGRPPSVKVSDDDCARRQSNPRSLGFRRQRLARLVRHQLRLADRPPRPIPSSFSTARPPAPPSTGTAASLTFPHRRPATRPSSSSAPPIGSPTSGSTTNLSRPPAPATCPLKPSCHLKPTVKPSPSPSASGTPRQMSRASSSHRTARQPVPPGSPAANSTGTASAPAFGNPSGLTSAHPATSPASGPTLTTTSRPPA